MPSKLTLPLVNLVPSKPTSPPGEPGAVEADLAAGELGAAEVAAVEDLTPIEVEGQALPGHRRAIFEVRGDDPDDGVADFAAGPEGKPLRPGSAASPGAGS